MPLLNTPVGHRRVLGFFATTAVLGLVVWALRVAPRAAEANDTAHAHAGAHAQMPMSQEDMQRWIDEWYAAHPARGEQSAGAFADTFRVFSFGFDNDGASDGVDTAHVFVGQSVLWELSDGSHTVTSGTGFADPNAGELFDQPIFFAQPSFGFQFDDAGTLPFFCRPHEGLMSGVVDVRVATDVVPISGRDQRAGFVVGPAPNPTPDMATFRFALGHAGRARVEVFDVRGRRVAIPVDRALAAGAYAAAWDGRTTAGDRAIAGVYYLRLTIPGATETRELTVAR